MSTRFALILAAGYSRRLGRPKRDVVIPVSLSGEHSASGVAKKHGVGEGEQSPTGPTLLEHAIGIAHAADFDVAVTLPPDANLADPKLAQAWPIVVANPAEGMAASLRTGVATIANDPTVHAVLVMLVDQWRLTTADLTTLTDAWRINGHHVAAARYNGVVGVPAIFGRSHLHHLTSATGDTGARDFLRSGDPAITAVDLPNAEADLDSPADLQTLATPARR